MNTISNVLLTPSLGLGPQPSCPADTVLHNGVCYFVSTEKATFDNAVLRCAARGGSLLSLIGNSQSTFVETLLQESFRLTQAKYWLIGKGCSQKYLQYKNNSVTKSCDSATLK